MRATFNGVTIAESERTVLLEGNHYFPADSVNHEYLKPTRSKSLCLWKGLASYYTVEANGATDRNAAWTYRRPSPAARRIKGHIAFWSGVEVHPVGDGVPTDERREPCRLGSPQPQRHARYRET